MARTGKATAPTDPDALRALLGDLDIQVADQLLRGRIRRDDVVLATGCGRGRNLLPLLRLGIAVRGADRDEDALGAARDAARAVSPDLPADAFRAEPVEAMTFEAACADVVLSIAVLHFARDDEHFAAMLAGTWRVLRPGGLLVCRLASTVAIGEALQPLGGRRFLQPDGDERYLVDEPVLLATTAELGGSLADPLKTTLVHGRRAMTTWVVRKAE